MRMSMIWRIMWIKDECYPPRLQIVKDNTLWDLCHTILFISCKSWTWSWKWVLINKYFQGLTKPYLDVEILQNICLFPRSFNIWVNYFWQIFSKAVDVHWVVFLKFPFFTSQFMYSILTEFGMAYIKCMSSWFL